MRDEMTAGESQLKSTPLLEIRGVGIIDVMELYSGVWDSSQIQIAVYLKEYARIKLWSSW